MDLAEKNCRWETVQELYRGAELALQHQLYRACTGLAYYASFQAMWVALGNPPQGEWRHVGVTRSFCHEQWADPPIIPTSLASLHKRLLALYELRLDAHYRAQVISQAEAQQGLKTVVDMMQLVQQTTKKDAEENP
jgi:uncharacterized protein (UPF0332 family)